MCEMKKIKKDKHKVVPDVELIKEFISQFKTEADVSKFLKQLVAVSIQQTPYCENC